MIVWVLQFKSYLFNIWGLPLITTRLLARECESIKNKILSRVKRWASRALGYAARVQLSISVLCKLDNASGKGNL